MRSALETYDAENERAPDRHAETCPCVLCGIVRDTRAVVATFDEEQRAFELERKPPK